MVDRPQRVQLSRRRGWRMPPHTVKVDRSTRFGNPFVTGRDGTRPYCVHLFKYLLADGLVALSVGPSPDVQVAAAARIRRDLSILTGRHLACWCPLSAPCHADVLLALANAWPIVLPPIPGVGPMQRIT